MSRSIKLLALAALVFVIAFSCEKDNRIQLIDISGFYSDTMTLSFTGFPPRDTIVFKQIFKINDSTFSMCRFLCDSQSPCDSVFLYIRPDNSIYSEMTGHNKVDCQTYLLLNWGTPLGAGYYDPVSKYLYIEHGNMGYRYITGINISGDVGAERMKKL